MSEVFLSYAKEDRERARILVAALDGLGWSVFWDRAVPAGLTWRNVIGAELEEARAVVVAWSEASANSQWVLEEAEQAKQRGVLIPVVIQAVEVPFGFGSLQAADLTSWDGSVDAPAFRKLIEDMSRILGAPPKRVEKERQRAEQEAREASEVPGPGAPGTPAGTGVEPGPAGREGLAGGKAAVDQRQIAETGMEGGSPMEYFKDKLWPGMISALIVVVVLGILNAASSGGLIRLMGGTTEQTAPPPESFDREVSKLRESMTGLAVTLAELRESMTGLAVTLADPQEIDCRDSQSRPEKCVCPRDHVLVGVSYLDNDPRGGGDADKIVGIQCSEIRQGGK